MKRGAVKIRKAELVALWIPKNLASAMDVGVLRTDSDRSKFIRNALREKLDRDGYPVPAEAAD